MYSAREHCGLALYKLIDYYYCYYYYPHYYFIIIIIIIIIIIVIIAELYAYQPGTG